MSEDETGDLDSARFVVEITNWDWHLSVGMPPASAPKSSLFQGWLMYTRGLEIEGRILAPAAFRGRTVSFWLLAWPAKLRLSKVNLSSPAFQRVGEFAETRSPDRAFDFTASAHLPEDALPSAVTALGSVWKILHLWTVGNVASGAAIERFTFSRCVPPKMVRDDWWGD